MFDNVPIKDVFNQLEYCYLQLNQSKTEVKLNKHYSRSFQRVSCNKALYVYPFRQIQFRLNAILHFSMKCLLCALYRLSEFNHQVDEQFNYSSFWLLISGINGKIINPKSGKSDSIVDESQEITAEPQPGILIFLIYIENYFPALACPVLHSISCQYYLT